MSVFWTLKTPALTNTPSHIYPQIQRLQATKAWQKDLRKEGWQKLSKSHHLTSFLTTGRGGGPLFSEKVGPYFPNPPRR